MNTSNHKHSDSIFNTITRSLTRFRGILLTTNTVARSRWMVLTTNTVTAAEYSHRLCIDFALASNEMSLRVCVRPQLFLAMCLCCCQMQFVKLSFSWFLFVCLLLFCFVFILFCLNWNCSFHLIWEGGVEEGVGSLGWGEGQKVFFFFSSF